MRCRAPSLWDRSRDVEQHSRSEREIFSLLSHGISMCDYTCDMGIFQLKNHFPNQFGMKKHKIKLQQILIFPVFGGQCRVFPKF